MNGVYEHLIVGFGILKFFVLTTMNQIDPVFEAFHVEVDGPGKLQEYGALNIKKKIDPKGFEKGAIDLKIERNINRLFLMGRYN